MVSFSKPIQASTSTETNTLPKQKQNPNMDKNTVKHQKFQNNCDINSSVLDDEDEPVDDKEENAEKDKNTTAKVETAKEQAFKKSGNLQYMPFSSLMLLLIMLMDAECMTSPVTQKTVRGKAKIHVRFAVTLIPETVNQPAAFIVMQNNAGVVRLLLRLMRPKM